MTSIDTDEFAKLEQSGWSEPATAQAYAADFAKAAEYSVETMLDRAGVRAGTRLLDLCCGHGLLSEAALARGAKVTGIDFSPAMLELARRRAPAATFREGDAMNLAMDDNSFDAVVIGFGLPHVPDPEQVFAEVARVLRPGGRLSYSVWEDAEGAMRYVFQAIGAHGAASIALPPGPGAHDYADPLRASEALITAGFEGIEFADVGSRWHINDPLQPLQFFKEGTVRGGAMLRQQPEQNLQDIREALRQKVIAQHGEGPTWDLPLPFVVISAAIS